MKFSKATSTVFVLTFLYSLFVFWGLGNVEMWGDEGIVALGSKRVLHFGYPQAWDGQNLFSFEAGHDLSESLVQKRLPWLAFYIGALGQFLFGENNFGARFGFALCGILNLPLLYWVGRKMSLSRRICVGSTLILMSLTSYFLYIRQSYHYSADITFSLIGLVWYLQIEKRWSPILLALSIVALFHLNYLSAIWFAFSLMLLSFWERKTIQLFKRPSVWIALFIAFVGTYGWMCWASVVEFQDSLGGWKTLLPHGSRLGFVLSELDMSFPLLFTIPILIWCARRTKQDKNLQPLFRFAVCSILSFLYLASYQFAWLRFYLFIFIILSWIWSAFLIDLFSKNRPVAIAISFLMFMTTIPYLLSHRTIGALWPAFARYSMSRISMEDLPFFARTLALGINPMLIDVPTELAAPPMTSLGEVIQYLRRHAKPKEKIVSLCDSEILQFRTKLLTTYLIDPRQLSYSKVAHLPSYIASYHDADWILLHHYWKRNYGMKELGDADQNQEILSYFRKSGAVLEAVPLKVRERFPNQLPNLWGHLWETDAGAPNLELYRVHWKKD